MSVGDPARVEWLPVNTSCSVSHPSFLAALTAATDGVASSSETGEDDDQSGVALESEAVASFDGAEATPGGEDSEDSGSGCEVTGGTSRSDTAWLVAGLALSTVIWRRTRLRSKDYNCVGYRGSPDE